MGRRVGAIRATTAATPLTVTVEPASAVPVITDAIASPSLRLMVGSAAVQTPPSTPVIATAVLRPVRVWSQWRVPPHSSEVTVTA
jgi:hypothetical protein